MGPVMIRVGIMATAFNLVDYRTVEPVRRPRLKIVEPIVAKAVVEPASAPVPPAPIVAEKAPAPEHKPMPPSWMIAPPIGGGQPAVTVTEPQAAYRPAPIAPAQGPYENVRQVPRASW